LACYEPVTNFGKLVFSGRTEFENYDLEKYIIEVASNNVLPFIVFSPKNPNNKVVLYLDDIEDKKSDQEYEIPLRLVKNGFMVIMPDLSGYGELGPGYFKGDAYFNNTSYNQWFAGILTGKSTVAIHVESIERVLHHCRETGALKSKSLIGISNGYFNSDLLHAASMGVKFDEFAMINPLISFESIVSNKDYEPSFIPFTVAGALKHYDLLDLAAAIAPNKLTIYNALDHLGQIASKEKVEESFGFVNEHYEALNSGRNFSIVVDKTVELADIQLSDYLEDLK
jgi:hypothetical protein